MLLKQEFKQLQSQGIPQMCQGSNDDEGLVVQAYNVALSKNDKLTCSISDGSCWVKAFLQDKALLKLGTFPCI